MRSRIAIAVLLLLAAASHAQGATLKGVILANEVGGPPVPNVQITAGGASPTVSGSDGTFALQFPGKQPGEMVRIMAQRQGYVVVNDIQLRLALPKDAEAELLILLLSKEGDREEMARRFYRLKSVEAVEQTYEKRVKELEKENRATTDALAELRRERDQAKAAAEKVAEELARLKPGSTSELYQQAMSLFLAGKPEEALKLLDDEKLRLSVEAARQRKAEAERELSKAIQAYLLKAQLLTTLFRFDEAEKTYQAAIEATPESFDSQFAFAFFNQQLNRFPKALAAYTRSLELARRHGIDANVAMTLNNLGNLHCDQNRMDEGRKAYEEALKIYRELAQKNPRSYLSDVAKTLNNLGILHRDQNRMDDARQAYEEALKIHRQLAQNNPATYLPDVALTLNNLSILQRDQNRLDEARQAFEEALKIYRDLAQKDPATYLSDVATTLNNLGVLHRDQDQMDDARQAYEEALKIRRQLAQNNPETYLPYLANTLNNLGVLHSDQNRMDDAQQAYEEALKTFRELAQKAPETYLPDVARTLNNLGVLHRDQNRMDEARQAYDEALKIRRKLAQDNPETYLPSIADTLNNLGILNCYKNQMDEARQAYDEALSIRRELAQVNPEIYLPYVAETLNNLGIMYRDQNRMIEARRNLEDALGIYEDLAKRNHLRYEQDVYRLKELLNDCL